MKAVLGIDVSSINLDSCILTNGKSYFKQFKNDNSGCKKLISWAKRHKATVGAVEASGGYERKISQLMRINDFDSHILNPLQVRNFAKGFGKKAKTDKIDAEMIAKFADIVPLEEKTKVTMTQYEMKQLVNRRFVLKKMQTGEKNRLRFAEGFVLENLKASIDFMEKQIKDIEKKLKELIKEDADISGKIKVLTIQKGIADTTATALVSLLPELGFIDKKKITSLVGLAPFARDSGKLKGKRFIYGGREYARKSLYMPAWVAVQYDPKINALYERLRSKGKKPKVAIVAVMRKLLIIANARIQKHIKNEKMY